MQGWAGAHEGQANQVMVDDTGVKESSAIFAAVSKFKCLSLLFVFALEPFLSQAACARVTEMGRDRPVGGRIKLLAHCSGTSTENLKFQGQGVLLSFSHGPADKYLIPQ